MRFSKSLIVGSLLVTLASYPTGFFSFSAYQSHLKQQWQELQEHKRQKAAEAVKDKQMKCLREALWFEARGESEQGIRAVATVIINRAKSVMFPDSICAVVKQRKQFSYTHQFKSFRIVPKKTEQNTLVLIDKIIGEVYTSDFVAVLPPDVLWYHTTRVNPSWSGKKQTVKIIGNHKFKRKYDV